MPDVLIRNFPAEDLTLLDEQAARLGISRSECQEAPVAASQREKWVWWVDAVVEQVPGVFPGPVLG